MFAVPARQCGRKGKNKDCLFACLFLRRSASNSWRKDLYLIVSWVELETVIIMHRKCDLVAPIDLKNLFLDDFIFLI